MNLIKEEELFFAFRFQYGFEHFKKGVINIDNDKLSDINYLWEICMMIWMYLDTKKKEDDKMSD